MTACYPCKAIAVWCVARDQHQTTWNLLLSPTSSAHEAGIPDIPAAQREIRVPMHGILYCETSGWWRLGVCEEASKSRRMTEIEVRVEDVDLGSSSAELFPLRKCQVDTKPIHVSVDHMLVSLQELSIIQHIFITFFLFEFNFCLPWINTLIVSCRCLQLRSPIQSHSLNIVSAQMAF